MQYQQNDMTAMRLARRASHQIISTATFLFHLWFGGGRLSLCRCFRGGFFFTLFLCWNSSSRSAHLVHVFVLYSGRCCARVVFYSLVELNITWILWWRWIRFFPRRCSPFLPVLCDPSKTRALAFNMASYTYTSCTSLIFVILSCVGRARRVWMV